MLSSHKFGSTQYITEQRLLWFTSQAACDPLLPTHPTQQKTTYGKKSSAPLLPSAGFITYENGKMHFWIKYAFKRSDREMPCCDRLAFTRACREHIGHFPSSSK